MVKTKFGAFFLGLSLGLVTFKVAGPLFSAFDQEGKKKISKLELDVRKKLEGISRKYGFTYSIDRNEKGVLLKVQDKKLFPVNDWTLSKKGNQVFKELSEVLKSKEGEFQFEISGHYDSVNPLGIGNSKLNIMALSSYRASNVASLLVGQGISPESLTLKAYGNFRPVVKDRDEEGNYLLKAGNLNRRLEILIKGKEV